MGANIKFYICETWAVLKELFASNAWRTAALFLFPYAGVLVGLWVAADYGELTDAHLPVQFFISSDGGFGEWLEYFLTSSVAVMLFWLWRRDGNLVYLANAVLFVYLTLDNALEFHEHFGYFLAPLFAGYDLPVRPNDVGEALLFAAIGLIWLVALFFSLRRAQIRPAIYAMILAACVVVAAFFGVIVDLLVVWGEKSDLMLEVETFIEDGGEFAMINIAFLVMVAIFDVGRRARGSHANSG